VDHSFYIKVLLKKQNDCTNKFVFEKVTTDKVEKIINDINIKKATGADGILAKIIKCSKSIITGPLFRKEWLNSFPKVTRFCSPRATF
jgi:hypothetical protein